MTTVQDIEKYEAFTIETVIDFAKEKGWFTTDSQVVATEIGDGNLNYVFRLVDENQKSLIVKQSLPYAKVVGESWPLTLKRATTEAEVLKTHGLYVPNLVPKIFFTDEALAITVMEDLSHLTIAREGLVAGKYYPNFVNDLTTYLANTLFYTSDFAMHPFDKKNIQAKFSNPELCKITEDLIFTDPYIEIDTNDFEVALTDEVQALWNNKLLKLEVTKLKYSFMTEGEALLHGDLHTGSVFINEQETKVIDPEFGFYGPMGFDIGQVLANLIFQYIVRKGEAKQQILKDVINVWAQFESKFTELWQKEGNASFAEIEGYLQSVLGKVYADTIGFAGAELIRRTIGLAHVKDLDSIVDDNVRIQAKKQVLSLGENLILKRKQMKDTKDLAAVIVGGNE